MKISGLCDRDTATALRLVGIKDLYIEKNSNHKDLWFNIIEKEDIGILLITEDIAEILDKYLNDYRIRNNIPIIIEIPNKQGRRKDHIDFVSHLIKKAVGIEVNK